MGSSSSASLVEKACALSSVPSGDFDTKSIETPPGNTMNPNTEVHMTAQSEDPVAYTASAYARCTLITQAMKRIDSVLKTPGCALSSPAAVRDYLCLHNAKHEDIHVERFSAMWLDSQNSLIEVQTLFTGTITQTSVYPREVVRAALKLNACAVVFSHNHPSGVTRPSRADENLTQTLKAALALVDVRVLDHIITSGSSSSSMAELGMV
jgi:DNA repair protein RadC